MIGNQLYDRSDLQEWKVTLLGKYGLKHGIKTVAMRVKAADTIDEIQIIKTRPESIPDLCQHALQIRRLWERIPPRSRRLNLRLKRRVEVVEQLRVIGSKTIQNPIKPCRCLRRVIENIDYLEKVLDGRPKHDVGQNPLVNTGSNIGKGLRDRAAYRNEA